MFIDFVRYNIKINVEEIGRDGMDWNYFAQDGDHGNELRVP
jgi:hypothetical protein